jgi:hypothetical protein
LQGLYLHTEQHKHKINAHNTDIHALSGIRTHDLCSFGRAKTVDALDRAVTVISICLKYDIEILQRKVVVFVLLLDKMR